MDNRGRNWYKNKEIFTVIQYNGNNFEEIKKRLKLKDAFIDSYDGSIKSMNKSKVRLKVNINDYIVYIGDGEYISCNEKVYNELYRR